MSCNKSITDNFISAMNSYYHPNCFCCQVINKLVKKFLFFLNKFFLSIKECGMPFNSSSFFEYNGLPYCEIHYHLKRGSLCSSCNCPINGRCITAMNKKFHPEHFICSFCTKQLNKGTFKEQNDKPYCHPCYTKMFPQ
jgi:paxillin